MLLLRRGRALLPFDHDLVGDWHRLDPLPLSSRRPCHLGDRPRLDDVVGRFPSDIDLKMMLDPLTWGLLHVIELDD